MIGALICWHSPRSIRLLIAVVVPALAIASILALSSIGTPAMQWEWSVFDIAIKPIIVQPFSTVFALGFSIVALLAGLFSYSQSSSKELSLGYAYTAGAVAIAYAGDFITLFISFEWIALLATIFFLF